NYISFAGYDPTLSTFNSQPSTFRDKWPALQDIGKDVLVPAHGIYWLIMLHAIGFPDDEMPQLLVHGWLNLAGAKMSKSAGNIIDPIVLADKYGVDALRYYLMSDVVTGQDADFSEERLLARYNADLANSLGNLLNRSLTMIEKYRVQKLTRPKSVESHPVEEYGLRVSPTLGMIEYVNAMTGSTPHLACQVALNLTLQCNQIVDAAKPWALAKDSADRKRVVSGRSGDL